MFRKFTTVLALGALLAGCKGGTTTTPPPVVTVQHLYVGNDNTPGTVQVYTLPITAASTPVFAFASNNVVAIGLDANGNAILGDNAGHLQYFAAPLAATSVPAATFNNGAASNNGQITFNNTGDFFVANVSANVNLFIHPFTNASVPSATTTGAGLVNAIGTALDNLGNLYVSNSGSGSTGPASRFSSRFSIASCMFV